MNAAELTAGLACRLPPFKPWLAKIKSFVTLKVAFKILSGGGRTAANTCLAFLFLVSVVGSPQPLRILTGWDMSLSARWGLAAAGDTSTDSPWP